jgi:hypothetical protein
MSVAPSEPETKLARSLDLSNKLATVFRTRAGRGPDSRRST